ncbi:hypothetical protein D2E42_05180 [Mycobacteroides abscessus]|nr:hypothetical protein DDJ68_04455 [Mycobacteroides abscessus]SKU65492.1 Uncharacterised protein [Mycobacteroides abscessus subsp. abscessus]PVB57971.1 hypothetical protein DDK10_05200 [Mycobacteroides abscessus]RIR78482.1 hypothetical protein D2E42_05180 [Mycobacteroides abscessus]RIR92965.1 hypothetical protein D2E57_14285 [Mycobacteroides abscessus]
MPRRRELRDVCQGVATSFGSRNNDIAGWWGIGVLCRQPGLPGIDLDLRADVHDVPLARRYGEQLDRQLSARRIPPEWVAGAALSLRFVPDPRDSVMWQYTVTVRIRDDRDRVWSGRDTGRCWAHDPARESRSARASRDTLAFRFNV